MNDSLVQDDHDGLHPDLYTVKEYLFNPCKLICTQLVKESESSEYGAYRFKLNKLSIRFRVAKTTPTKAGQFVTLWERSGKGPIQPFDLATAADFFVICTRTENHFGQFVFPKSVLAKQGVLSIAGKGGKRAIRVYSPWDTSLNRQAQKTQQWQLPYFLEIPSLNTIDYARAKLLYGV